MRTRWFPVAVGIALLSVVVSSAKAGVYNRVPNPDPAQQVQETVSVSEKTGNAQVSGGGTSGPGSQTDIHLSIEVPRTLKGDGLASASIDGGGNETVQYTWVPAPENPNEPAPPQTVAFAGNCEASVGFTLGDLGEREGASSDSEASGSCSGTGKNTMKADPRKIEAKNGEPDTDGDTKTDTIAATQTFQGNAATAKAVAASCVVSYRGMGGNATASAKATITGG